MHLVGVSALIALLLIRIESKESHQEKKQIVNDVHQHQGFITAKEFLQNYVSASVPLLMKSTANSLFKENFEFYALKSMPESFTTYLNVSKNGEDFYRFMSINQFVNVYSDENLFIDASIPPILKSLVTLPQILQCKAILENLHQTRLIIRSGDWKSSFSANDHHSFICQVNGNSRYHLIHPTRINSKSALSDANKNSISEDHSLHPDLSHAEEYTLVSLEPGDCVYIPFLWCQQWNTTGEYVGLTMSWNSDINSSLSKECQEQQKQLLSLNFPNDPEEDIFAELAFIEMHYFIKKYYLKTKDSMNLESFVTAFLMDKHIDGILKWNDECKEIAREELLDVAGRIEDRLADFQDIIDDQQLENKGSVFDIAKKASDQTDEIRKLIEDGFSEIFNDIEAAKSDGSTSDKDKAKERTTSHEMEQIKKIEKLIKDSISENSNMIRDSTDKFKKDEL
ncbi:uncharacterized protein LOC118185549 isoform X2 [Stegodyphus dumicola]|uniref:uncharacterized protein LOC118185549 isoform X2 n=1 Tax=Stegodyphus dumicola TaxID=202533 RepID=UPI0015B30CC5|nr:uncharacterized protein LOC118185549 isoform X2 [Stegodyphus dumicola]